MCGIAGVVEPHPSEAVLRAMSERIAHRGPDGDRIVVRDDRVGLAHRRLAIIDLSEAGSQPMRSPSGAEVIYNGEIYNYLELRAELAGLGVAFHTESDTEVLLAAYDRWGPACLERLNGMFAFALYDPARRMMFAARDRFGEKPFYYHRAADGSFVFASEIKALLVHPKVPCHPDLGSVFGYLRYKETDRDPHTFFEGIHALPAAHYLTVDVDTGSVEVRRYWALADGARASGTPAELAERFHDLLADSIRLRLRSDVPVGSSLSGGLDSSAIVGYIAKACGVPHQHTFSARFPGSALDEGRYMADVVALTGAAGHEVAVAPDANELSRTVWHQEQPFISLSILAQWSVMRLARDSGVTVLLDGQGADETLAGYHFFWGAQYREMFRRGRWLRLVQDASAYASANGLGRLAALGYYTAPTEVTRQAKRLVPARGVSREFAAAHGGVQAGHERVFGDHLSQALYVSTTSTMLPALLRYADRNSMAFAREVRLPYLDHRVVEFAFSLPNDMRLDGPTTKVILRLAMRDYLPDSVRTRLDKVGFAPPQRTWLLGPLAGLVDEVVADRRTEERPWTDPGRLPRTWAALRAGDPRPEAEVMRLLSLELWARQYLDQDHVAAVSDLARTPVALDQHLAATTGG
jgi:asparagine synthase (glutamine-hydrolysing)